MTGSSQKQRLAMTWMLLLPCAATLAAPPDYSHLGDEALGRRLVAIAIGLVAFAGLGLYGWWRYRRRYVPAPGRFTPNQALACVLAVIVALLVGAAAWMR